VKYLQGKYSINYR